MEIYKFDYYCYNCYAYQLRVGNFFTSLRVLSNYFSYFTHVTARTSDIDTADTQY